MHQMFSNQIDPSSLQTHHLRGHVSQTNPSSNELERPNVRFSAHIAITHVIQTLNQCDTAFGDRLSRDGVHFIF